MRLGVRAAGSHGTAVPGFVDAHINGIAGVDFIGADEQGYRHARQALAATGVVAFQPTFVSSPPASYFEPLALAGALSADGPPAGAGGGPEGPLPFPPW